MEKVELSSGLSVEIMIGQKSMSLDLYNLGICTVSLKDMGQV